MFDTRKLNLHRFNSITKYPSILTMHKLDNKGNSSDVFDVRVQSDKDYYLTEKIDGTNSRIILLPDNKYMLGSREELLTASGDIIYNPVLGIVDTLRPYAEHILENINLLNPNKDQVIVIYGETFGGHTHKNAVAYTGDQSKTAFRMFDVQLLSLDKLDELNSLDDTRVATWREHNNQNWLTVEALQKLSTLLDIPHVPYLKVVKGADIETTPSKVYAWLNEHLPSTLVKLDAAGQGFPEGIIARTADRKSILKIRNANYKRIAEPVYTSTPTL